MAKRKRSRRDLNKLQVKWINPPKDKIWAKLFLDTLESAAWRKLKLNERRAYDAILCQHYRYKQKENGKLEISYVQFERAGLTRRMVAPSLANLDRAGLITRGPGVAREGLVQRPVLYGLRTHEPKGLIADARRKFVWVLVEVMETAGWCGLSRAARLVMDRLLIEDHKQDMGRENGELHVSFGQFVEHGVTREQVHPAIKELAAAGFLKVRQGKSRGCLPGPNIFLITFKGTIDNPAQWQSQEPEAPQKERPKMPRQRNSRHPLSEPIPHPLSEPSNAFPAPTFRTVEPHFPHPLSELSMISRPSFPVDGRAAPAAAAPLSADVTPFPKWTKPKPRDLEPQPGSPVPRREHVEAYVLCLTHKIGGLVTHDEDLWLRDQFSLGELSADEWALVDRALHPPVSKPEARYRAVKRGLSWLIVDGEGNEVSLAEGKENDFDSMHDAWAEIDRLRGRAACGMKQTATILTLPLPVKPRPPNPRRERGH